MKGGIETIKLSKLAKEKSEKLWCKIWIICIGKWEQINGADVAHLD